MSSARKPTGVKKFFKRAALSALLIISVILAFRIYAAVNYPIRYTAEIDAASRDFGVAPEIILAVIRTESGFRPDAVSKKGAAGLMQILPSTGEYLHKKVYAEPWDESRLYDADVNIYLGTYYLGRLLVRFKDLLWAAAAYNAGEGNAEIWRSAGLSLSEIPFRETREYVVKFEKAYKRYAKILKRSPAFSSVG